MVLFGQLVVGPPGAGKSTYCDGMQQLIHALRRADGAHCINLDPANDQPRYEVALDIRDLVSVERVMEEHSLGPNGALVFAMEYVLENLDWLTERILKLRGGGGLGPYLLIDCPGQVELFTHYDVMTKLVSKLQRQLDLRLCAVHLLDGTLCGDGHRFLAGTMCALSAMAQMELPHVNVLSKMDLVVRMKSSLAFTLPYFCEGRKLQHVVNTIGHEGRDWTQPNSSASEDEDDSDAPVPSGGPRQRPDRGARFDPLAKFRKFNRALAEVIDDYSLVHFHPLDITFKDSVTKVLASCDLANGRVMAAEHSDETGSALFNSAIAGDFEVEQILEQMEDRAENEVDERPS